MKQLIKLFGILAFVFFSFPVFGQPYTSVEILTPILEEAIMKGPVPEIKCFYKIPEQLLIISMDNSRLLMHSNAVTMITITEYDSGEEVYFVKENSSVSYFTIPLALSNEYKIEVSMPTGVYIRWRLKTAAYGKDKGYDEFLW